MSAAPRRETRHDRTQAPRRARLAEVARKVRADAKAHSARYLETTEVPEGGE